MITVFEYNLDDLYRFCWHADQGYPCVERFGSPVADIATEDGVFMLSFHAKTVVNAKEIIVVLQEEFDGVRLRRLF